MLMPTTANGIDVDWNIARARAENFELEYRPVWLPKRSTVVRGLAFVNHANMGSYREAIAGYLSGKDAVPDVTLYRKQGTVKYGFGLNVEQELTDLWRAFGRLGWNDGRTETYAYTEIDRTVQFGTDFRGKPWHRSDDKLGAAYVSNGLSADHTRYLALGGLGFILGDGALNYGTERIFETYYTAQIWRGISCAFDYQHVSNPGYNRDRGPVDVFSVRLHIEEAFPLKSKK